MWVNQIVIYLCRMFSWWCMSDVKWRKGIEVGCCACLCSDKYKLARRVAALAFLPSHPKEHATCCLLPAAWTLFNYNHRISNWHVVAVTDEQLRQITQHKRCHLYASISFVDINNYLLLLYVDYFHYLLASNRRGSECYDVRIFPRIRRSVTL